MEHFDASLSTYFKALLGPRGISSSVLRMGPPPHTVVGWLQQLQAAHSEEEEKMFHLCGFKHKEAVSQSSLPAVIPQNSLATIALYAPA
ncbi:PREDICTED: elongation of very long chain fatty acids protein 5 isoform X4 [Rhinopithecus bieti]|uniref:ELOVL fatty acid elongase 5 n=4 Tax=Cercopithecidae TaxID=9527 RepID=A0A2K6A294_MANLE|nr:PREDICTED: elongation of very long chain fatty acids protein 5 isoform X4 [Colobus angolensis palliatus]XP_017713718.1 PREDICTED: elongation of very long chain fatty acids protein 5 isoform X4 [Rhinopithecus bieti]XP_033073357.1 elongation of very long chain fatty acids protein 5 isoform X2 [Trachypithecus francoisi]XP_033073358.1 elongation of very long chain fatty acids protein 5 isoform X2 [Trachypithecus francoisi]XP_033073359.1 elongation of very long chain fatty acids protein 5 isoform